MNLNSEIQRVKGISLNNEQTAVVNEAKKLLSDMSSRPSIYVHNYELIKFLIKRKDKDAQRL